MKENKIEHRESDAINLDAAFAEGHDSSRQCPNRHCDEDIASH